MNAPVKNLKQDVEVIWAPLPGSQGLIMSCPAQHILYEGTRGPGKTDAQLMFFRKHVGRGFGSYWRGVIFDREYKNLDDLISKSRRWFPMFEDGARFLSAKSDYKWVWPTGEELMFRQVKAESDYWNYHGQEFPFIGWNELCKYPTRSLYDSLMSCNRSSFLEAEHAPREKAKGTRIKTGEIPLVVFSTTNPYGPGHLWVKKDFIDIAPPGKMVRLTRNIYNPRTNEKEDFTITQVRIFGSYKENRYLSPQYIAQLEGIRDPNKRKAWLHGDWNIVAGGALDDVWNEGVHVIPRFKVPSNWRIDRTFDWGSSHPFSVGWWAEANGEAVTLPDGTSWNPAPGSFIRVDEWYGTAEIGTNTGLRKSAKEIAVGIKSREDMLLSQGWINGRVRAGPADGQIYNRPHSDEETIAKKMEDEGVYWVAADKSKGSRVNGLQLFRDRLEAGVAGEGAALYFMNNCKAAITILPTLPRDEDNLDDVDTDAEDHVYDEVRYKVLSGNDRVASADELKIKYPS